MNFFRTIEAGFVELLTNIWFWCRKQKKCWHKLMRFNCSYFYEFFELHNDTYIIRIMRYKPVQHYFYCSNWCCCCRDISKTLKLSRSCQHFFCSLYVQNNEFRFRDLYIHLSSVRESQSWHDYLRHCQRRH